MHYMGGKFRTGRRLYLVMKHYLKGKNVKGYLEPFCGALGLLRYFTDYAPLCVASDGCKDLILLWNEVKNETFEKPTMNKEQWDALKDSKESSALRAFAGFGLSFNGRWFSSYVEDHLEVSYRSLEVLKPKIKNVQFEHKDYRDQTELVREGGWVIHCDPPYANSFFTHDASSFPFDMDEFWETMRKWTRMGNIVFISERTAPPDFECIWQATLPNNRTAGTKTYVDKLFMLKTDDEEELDTDEEVERLILRGE